MVTYFRSVILTKDRMAVTWANNSFVVHPEEVCSSLSGIVELTRGLAAPAMCLGPLCTGEIMIYRLK